MGLDLVSLLLPGLSPSEMEGHYGVHIPEGILCEESSISSGSMTTEFVEQIL